MDPNFIAHLAQPQRHDDGLEHEYVTYRAPSDRGLPRLTLATRRHLSTFFLVLGERLYNEPRATDTAAPVERTATSR